MLGTESIAIGVRSGTEQVVNAAVSVVVDKKFQIGQVVAVGDPSTEPEVFEFSRFFFFRPCHLF